MSEGQRYRVRERLASGGMAEVFLAEALGVQGFSKKVAIKRVLPNLAKKEAFIRMFLDEARLSARLSHGNCVQVFDIGVGDDTYFIVMEFVDGADLRAVLDALHEQRRPFPVEEAVFIAVELCKGLEYAHHLVDEAGNPLGIVHRDLSPPNVLLTKHGEVKIVDFGLAKANTQLEKSEPGVIKGKYSYLAPEMIQSQTVDGRADLFAVAAILWEMLAGKRLFLGKTDLDTVRLAERADVPPITTLRSDVSPELEPILARALSQHPDNRYGSGAELGSALASYLHMYGRRAVSSFDIRSLVREVLERQRESKAAAKRASGDMPWMQFMEEVSVMLLKFESLGENSRIGSTPLDIGSFAPHDSDDGGRPSLPHPVSAGNLADLEGPDLEKQSGRGASTTPPPIQVVPPRAGRGRMVIVALLFLVLGVAIALFAQRTLHHG